MHQQALNVVAANEQFMSRNKIPHMFRQKEHHLTLFVCYCNIDEVLDLEFRGKRYVARVTKFEMYKSSKSSGGSSSSRDGELLIYLKVHNNIVHCR